VYFDRQRDIAERSEREKEKKALIEKAKKATEKKPDATVTIGPKPEEKKPETKKPEEKKPEEKPKPPQTGSFPAEIHSDSSASHFGGGR
jgi:predicted ribosome quality control (RQC) complex YloA/Tae2 family protein